MSDVTEVSLINLRDSVSEYFIDNENPDFVYDENYSTIIGDGCFTTELLRFPSNKTFQDAKPNANYEYHQCNIRCITEKKVIDSLNRMLKCTETLCRNAFKDSGTELLELLRDMMYDCYTITTLITQPSNLTLPYKAVIWDGSDLCSITLTILETLKEQLSLINNHTQMFFMRTIVEKDATEICHRINYCIKKFGECSSKYSQIMLNENDWKILKTCRGIRRVNASGVELHNYCAKADNIDTDYNSSSGMCRSHVKSKPKSNCKSQNQSVNEIRGRILNMAKQCDKDIEECINLIDTFKFAKDTTYTIKNACNMLSNCRNMATSMDKFFNNGKCSIAQQARVTANMTLYGLLIAIANSARYYVYYAYEQTQVFPDIVSAFYRLTRYINKIEKLRDMLSDFKIDHDIIEELKMPNIKIVLKL